MSSDCSLRELFRASGTGHSIPRPAACGSRVPPSGHLLGRTSGPQTGMCRKSDFMQNIDLICVGKLNAKYFAEGVAEYQKRLAAFANFRILELPEEKIEEKNASDAVVKKALEKEGKAILGNVRKGAAIVAMCIEGKQISSEELAQFLADRAGSGAGDVAFVIGSSHGLADEVKRAAALKFSMGRITMPHQLARLVLTEQIYRACTINAGMKYHK